MLNAAVSSYSPIIYWRKIQHLIEDRKLDFDALFVFLDLSDPQDETFYKLDSIGAVVNAPGSPERAAFLRSVEDARQAASGSTALPLRERLGALGCSRSSPAPLRR